MRTPIPYALVVCFAVCAAACDQSSGDARGPSAPTAPTAPGSPVNRHQPILISSGDDGSPVAGARVTINGDEFGGNAQCATLANWGFCRAYAPFGNRVYQVLPERARDRPTIRRVLASFFLGPNPLPGLMNVSRPLDDLSGFERRTIRMILQRKLPNRWPDSDR